MFSLTIWKFKRLNYFLFDLCLCVCVYRTRVFLCIPQALKYTYFSHYNLRCQRVSSGTDERTKNEILYIYAYFAIKIFDLLDTVFIVLRKKWNQISFLHLYHHVGVCLGAWIAMKFFPGGHVVMLGILNCFVHVFMYFYYLISSLNPELKKNLWWKKYITQIQIIQFAFLTVHFTHPLLFPDKECGYPIFPLAVGSTQNVFMLLMFSDFYVKAYLKKDNKKLN